MLKADCAGGNNDVAGFDLEVDAAASAGANKRISADVVKLFHRDRGGRPADAGGANAHLFAEKGTGIDRIFPILRNKLCVIKQVGNGFAAPGIAGQNHIAANVAFHAMDVELFVKLLHVKAPFCLLIHFDYTIIRQNLQ